MRNLVEWINRTLKAIGGVSVPALRPVVLRMTWESDELREHIWRLFWEESERMVVPAPPFRIQREAFWWSDWIDFYVSELQKFAEEVVSDCGCSVDSR
jgi:hypothetical protein